MKRRTLRMAALALAVTILPGTVSRSAGAQETVELRIATLVPRGSAWMRVFDAWGNSLRQETNGRLTLRFFPGGSQGDEREMIRKIRVGQLDGAAVTSTGLGLVHRPLLVLQAPGVIQSYSQLDRVRTGMNDELARGLEGAEGGGMKLLGWSDYGQARIFSTEPIRTPADLRARRPWVLRDDRMFAAFLDAAGAGERAVRLDVPEVLPALTEHRVDTVVASATAASALQWHTQVRFVTQQPSSIIIGATILSKARYDALPEDLRAALTSTSARAHQALARRMRQDDDRYYAALTAPQGALTVVDLASGQAAWDRVATQARRSLTGEVFSAELLARVMAARGE